MTSTSTSPSPVKTSPMPTPQPGLAGASPLTPTSALTPTFFVPAGDLVNIRTAPTTRSRPLGRLIGPFSGNILGRSFDGQWLQFFLPRVSRVGWIRSDVVKIKGYYEEPAPAPATATPAPVPAAPNTVASVPRVLVPRGDVVNVRNGPGVTFNVLGRMRARQTAVITGKSADGTWWQILFGKNPAWINATFVRTSGNLGDVQTVP